MMLRRLAGAALLLALAALLWGCGQQEPAGYRFVDALERPVSVEDPRRVVALMGGFAEVWQLAGGELAGVTTDAVEERSLGLPETVGVVGAFNEPSLEAVLALDPDFVLLSSETPAHVALEAALTGAGVPSAYFRVNDFADYLHMLHICTDITGRADLYTAHGEAVADEIAQVTAPYRDREGPTALLLITYSGGAAVQSADSMAGGMLSELGCHNLADDYPSLLREFSMETVIALDPDFLLVIPMGNDDALAQKNLSESVESHPAWSGLTAVQQGQYRLLPKDLFLYKPNARWAESYSHLAEILYAQ